MGFNWRFQPALQEIRRMVQDGRLGRLPHIEGNCNGPSVYRTSPARSTRCSRRVTGSPSTEGGTPYACPADDAVHGVAVFEAIVQSARSGQREPIG